MKTRPPNSLAAYSLTPDSANDYTYGTEGEDHGIAVVAKAADAEAATADE